MHRVTTPHGVREDPFYWLRDDTRSDPQVLAHLRAETAYAEAVLAPAQALIEELYREIVGRIKQDDSSVPVRYRGYWYASRFVSGGQYPLIVRWADSPQAREVVLLDCNALAVGQPFFQLGGYEVEPGQHAARLCGGYGRTPPVPDPLQGHRHAASCWAT